MFLMEATIPEVAEVPVANLASLVLGLITPLVVSVINQPKYTAEQRRLIAIAAAVAIGFLGLVVQGAAFSWEWSWAGVVTNLVLVIGAAQAAYSMLWKPTGVSDKVEDKTSPTL